MGYYVRAFCASEKVPTPRALLEYAKKKGFSLGLEADGIDMDNANWEQLVWVYKDGKLPILMECNRDTSEDCLFREEIAEFIDFIGKPGFSVAKRRVIAEIEGSGLNPVHNGNRCHGIMKNEEVAHNPVQLSNVPS